MRKNATVGVDMRHIVAYEAKWNNRPHADPKRDLGEPRALEALALQCAPVQPEDSRSGALVAADEIEHPLNVALLDHREVESLRPSRR